MSKLSSLATIALTNRVLDLREELTISQVAQLHDPHFASQYAKRETDITAELSILYVDLKKFGDKTALVAHAPNLASELYLE